MSEQIVLTAKLSPDQINREVSHKIARIYNLEPKQRLFYEALRSFMNSESFEAYPSIATIARMMKCSRNTAKKYINQLANLGLISIKERIIKPKDQETGKWNDTHIYTFIAEKLGNAVRKKRSFVEVLKSGVQVQKERFTSAVEVLSREFDHSLCMEAFNKGLSNVRRGVTSCIKDPVKYLRGIINNMLREREEAKHQAQLLEDPDIKEMIESAEWRGSSKQAKPSLSTRPIRAKKTKFHNFEQRSSRYSAEEINGLIANKNKKREETQEAPELLQASVAEQGSGVDVAEILRREEERRFGHFLK